MAPSPELSYLQRVVMEIMETEHTYVQDLHSIVEGYLAHIIDTADLPIIPEQVCALFGNIEDIYEFNSELLQELDLCRNDPVAIARCFVLKRDYFEIYTQYCTNYPNSVAALTDCMRNKTLLKFFMDRQEALKHPLPLGSYLLKPVQRILKYHLLLQEIAKHFDPDEEGYDVVEEAINTMTEVAWYINTMKRKHEHAVRLQEVQSLLINWRGPDLTTYGELVLEETFRFHHTKNNRTLFLFERVLLITKRRGENFIYKTHISCSMLMLMEGEKDSLCFSVTHYKHPKHPHIVQARTLDEKKLWTHHIKRLILENHHTIIPQKAKEVILEMDPMYEKYRFNWSERKKKTQSDDFTHTRHSEFTKQLMENNKSMLKDEEWQAHGNPRVSEREDRAVCEDPNTNQTSQRVSQFRGFEQEIKSMSGDQRLSVDLVSAVEGTEQCAGKDGALNLDGHSSEEEVEENGAGSQNHSILPSSVLDKAGVIAEHFIANARRSLTPVELRSPHRTPQEVTPSKNTTANSAPLSPREEKGSEQHQWNRRESILSKKEQLLIDKIRNYYENAEEEDAGFSLKRRESLSYIPSGLVRTSVSRLNKIPLTDHQTTPPNTQSSPLTSSIAPSDTSTEPDKPRRLFSTEASVSHRAEKSEECFRSSAEMIKVWQEMEKQVTSSRRENTSRDLSRFRGTSSLLQGFSRNAESRGRQVQLKGAEDLSTITEESAAKGKEEEKEKASTENAVWSLTKNLQSTDAVNQPRRRVSATTVYTGDEGNIQSLTDRETGKSNLALSLDLQRPHASSVRNVTILSPELSHFLKSPMPVEGFPWPDVRKLRSMYTSLECPSLAPLSPDCRTDNRVSPIPQTGSLDQKLSSFDWTNVQNGNMNRDYCVTAQGALPNNRTITVLEKVKTHAQPSLSQNQVRIQSPMSREKTLSLSISQRCQLYEDLDEAVFRTKPESRNKDNKTDQHSSATQHSTF